MDKKTPLTQDDIAKKYEGTNLEVTQLRSNAASVYSPTGYGKKILNWLGQQINRTNEDERTNEQHVSDYLQRDNFTLETMGHGKLKKDGDVYELTCTNGAKLDYADRKKLGAEISPLVQTLNEQLAPQRTAVGTIPQTTYDVAEVSDGSFFIANRQAGAPTAITNIIGAIKKGCSASPSK
jgi:hypothetical protein